MSMFLSFWILPIVFILHDFEEMIMVPAWKRRESGSTNGIKRRAFGAVTDGPALCSGVAEEMVLLVIVSIACSLTGGTTLYLTSCGAYTFHLVVHILACPLARGYVPGAITALAEMPFMAWLIVAYWHIDRSGWPVYLLWQAAALAVFASNLKLIHTLMPKIQTVLLRYANH
ncbi:HXXEE domain-containing protein [Bifidobacterium sp. ESL0763]|uniref:HXXEE domain-containing protein n=1 Tax=Bifidobacterium sp. ESL0763 TaxID=2983227 RepID=UPI0023F9D4D8|nr:HXXEE domain-containing protein [Bifidobacterium sp. ESL0763]MDF7663495.1 HXXEE domain-containing protein [Bifidobacterium sp. ESL0763]